MLHSPDVFLTLHGDREYAKTFTESAFKVLNDWKRLNSHLDPMEVVKIEEELSGSNAKVIIKMHQGMSNMHIIAYQPQPEPEKPEKPSREVTIVNEKPSTTLFNRVYVHVDVLLKDSASLSDDEFGLVRSDVSSAVAIGIWDNELKQMYDISTHKVPYLNFFHWQYNHNNATVWYNHPGDWEGMCSDVADRTDGIVQWYEDNFPSIYGFGKVHVNVTDSPPFVLLSGTGVHIPADWEYKPTNWDAVSSFATYQDLNRPYSCDSFLNRWFSVLQDPPNPNVLYHTVANGCGPSSYYAFFLRDQLSGTDFQSWYIDTVRRFFDMPTLQPDGDIYRRCGTAYRYAYNNYDDPQHVSVIGYNSGIFNEIFNGMVYATDYNGHDGFAALIPIASAYQWQSYFDPPSGVMNVFWGWRLQNVLYGYAPQFPTVSAAFEYFGDWPGIFGFETSRVLPDGLRWFGEAGATLIRETGGGHSLRGLVNLNLLFVGDEVGEAWEAVDTEAHLLPTEAVCDLYERAVVEAGGYIIDPATITDEIIAYRIDDSFFGFSPTHDVRALPGTRAGSPIFNLKIYVAPIMVENEPEVEEYSYGVD